MPTPGTAAAISALNKPGTGAEIQHPAQPARHAGKHVHHGAVEAVVVGHQPPAQRVVVAGVGRERPDDRAPTHSAHSALVTGPERSRSCS